MSEKDTTKEIVRRRPNPVVDDPVGAGRRGGLRTAQLSRERAARARERFEAKLDAALAPAGAAYVEALKARKDDEVDHSTRIAAADRIANRRLGMPVSSVQAHVLLDVDIGQARDKLAALMARQAGQGEQDT